MGLHRVSARLCSIPCMGGYMCQGLFKPSCVRACMCVEWLSHLLGPQEAQFSRAGTLCRLPQARWVDRSLFSYCALHQRPIA